MSVTLLTSPIVNAPKIHQLSSGLTVIAEQMPVEAVNFNLWLNVGSAKEHDEINGMAHFLEHMVFKGTAQLEIGEFERLIEERGAVTNAATSQEYTHYYITTAPKDFAALAPLQLDVVLNPMIPENAFEREKLVVLEEIRRSEDNPRRRTFYRSMETCFEKLPYRRPVLGSTKIIEGLTAQQMRDFHSRWYQPESMTVAVVGNLPADELIAIVADGVAKVSEHSSFKLPQDNLDGYESQHKPLLPEPIFDDIVRREYVDESLHQARLVMMWRVPGMLELEETYALDILAAILGQGKMSRLFRDLREDQGLVSHIAASNMTQGVQGVFYVSANLPTENIPAVEQAIASHIRSIQENSISIAELERIRTQVANRFIFSNERPSDRANLYGYYHSLLGNLEPALKYPSYIQSLNPKDVQTAALNYLSTTAYGIVVSKPAQN